METGESTGGDPEEGRKQQARVPEESWRSDGRRRDRDHHRSAVRRRRSRRRSSGASRRMPGRLSARTSRSPPSTTSTRPPRARPSSSSTTPTSSCRRESSPRASSRHDRLRPFRRRSRWPAPSKSRSSAATSRSPRSSILDVPRSSTSTASPTSGARTTRRRGGVVWLHRRRDRTPATSTPRSR